MQRRPKQTSSYDRSVEDPNDEEVIESDVESVTEKQTYFINSVSPKIMSRYYVSYRALNYVLTVALMIVGLAYLRERDLRLELMTMAIVNDNRIQKTVEQQNNIISHDTSCPPCVECDCLKNFAVTTAVDLPDMPADYEEILNDWKTRYDRLVIQVQTFSKVLLLQKYGTSPYFVDLDIQVDNNEHVKNGKLTIELPYSERMPYSTFYFLSQVQLGLWNSCSFFINLGVVYLDEARGSLDTSLCDISKFSDHSIIDTEGIMQFLAFQEYHSDIRHEELTVGLSGRPGGRGFYFNAQNNTKAHQPRGVPIPGAPPLQGDPCIGRLVVAIEGNGKDEGTAFLKKLKQMEHQTAEGVTERLFQSISSFQSKVWIKSATIRKMK